MSRLGGFSVRVALAAAVALAGASPVRGGEVRHTVRPGESVSAIAKRYLGDYDHAGVLLQLNGRSTPTIHAGETLRVPYCDVHTVRPGDTWSVLAQRYLDRPGAWRAVAALNDVAPDAPLRVGQRLVMPVVLTVRLQPGDSLAGLAGRYLGDSQRAEVLQRFNGIDDPRRLSVGQSVQVPLMDLRRVATRPAPAKPRDGGKKRAPATTASSPTSGAAATKTAPARPSEAGSATGTKTSRAAPRSGPDTGTPPRTGDARPDPAAVSRSSTPSGPVPRFGGPLSRAAAALRRGDFDRARRILEPLAPEVEARGLERERDALWRMLVDVYVAFDRTDAACDAQRSRPGKPPAGDPDLVSPKVRSTLSSCDRS